MEYTEKSQAKAHILQRIKEFPFRSKNFYLKQLSISHHRFNRIVEEMVQEESIVERKGLDSRGFTNSKFRPKRNTKYLMLR